MLSESELIRAYGACSLDPVTVAQDPTPVDSAPDPVPVPARRRSSRGRVRRALEARGYGLIPDARGFIAIRKTDRRHSRSWRDGPTDRRHTWHR